MTEHSSRPVCHNSPVCGRYRLSRRKQVIEEHFDAVSGDEDWGPRYNIAPTQPVPVIRQNPREPIRELSLMRWGLIPSPCSHHGNLVRTFAAFTLSERGRMKGRGSRVGPHISMRGGWRSLGNEAAIRKEC